MHVLVTGHTGFKGAWLVMMLRERGHEVSGIALDPEPESLFLKADVADLMDHDIRQDIRDGGATRKAIESVSPDAVIHLAAQPLVRASYSNPRWTFETNVMGTLAVLEGIAAAESVQGALIVTTDKVYRNVEDRVAYREEDPLGGHDPYSSSKAMADLMVASWAASFSGPPIATARAGNVIGGGDRSTDRLVPDLIRGFERGDDVLVRNPEAVRPWQHVLDCLNGYTILMNAIVQGHQAGAWNFGPDQSSWRTVSEVADRTAAAWGGGASWVIDLEQHPHEASLLMLDSDKARTQLGWGDQLNFDEAIEWTVTWQKSVLAGESAREVSLSQLRDYQARLDGGQ